MAPPDAAAAASTASSQHKKKKKNHTHDHAGSESLENMGFTYNKKKRKSLMSTFNSPDKNSSPTKSPRRSPRLAKASAAKVSGLDVDLTEEELHPPRNSEKLLALPESNWRAGRCHCVGECRYCVLLTDPADDDEKYCWDKSLITLDDLPDDVDIIPENFEDPRGLYANLGSGLSKVSSQAEIKAAWKKEKKLFHQNSLKTHPDKNPDNPNAAEEFRAVQERWNKADFAFSILGNDFGLFIDRYNYDHDGERLREAFKRAFEAANPGKSFKVMADELREKKERAERYERRNATTMARAAGGDSLFDRIAKRWKDDGLCGTRAQATNGLRCLIVDAFREGSTPSELSRFLRTSLYRKPSDLFDGRGNSDKIYKSILEKIGRFKKEWRAGNYDHLVNHIPIKDMTTRERMQYNSAMKSRTVKINARGLHVLNEHYAIEKKLIAKLEELWENDKCVSRTVVFRLVLEIDPDFLVSGGQGGRGSTGHLDRLKTWFYHGFKKRFNLSNRKIASIGQKLPDKWREKLRTQQQRVAAAQFPQEVDLGNGEKVNVPGSASVGGGVEAAET
eukprot:scaffold248579_cov38-Cyclotella_meneghiniana.AAC.1